MTATDDQATGRRTVRFGVLGCADIARRRMLPALAPLAEAELTAVAARDPGRAAEVAAEYGCAAEPDYAALLERPDIDAVYVPLPVALHVPWTERALRAGKHVLAEKPLAPTVEQAVSLADLARSQGLLLAENYMFLHHAQHLAVRGLLGDQAIGELRSFSAGFTVPPFPEDSIRYRRELGGGALLDIGVHPLRAARYFLGEHLEVAGAVLRHDGRHEVDVAGHALLTTPEGVTADIAFGMDRAYRCRYELSGSTGRITLDRAFTPPEDHPPVVRIERAGGTREITLSPDRQFANAAQHFCRTVLDNDTAEFARHGEEVVRQAELVGRVMDSAVHRAPAPDRTRQNGN